MDLLSDLYSLRALRALRLIIRAIRLPAIARRSGEAGGCVPGRRDPCQEKYYVCVCLRPSAANLGFWNCQMRNEK